MADETLESTLALLDIHHRQFFELAGHARRTGQPVPMDTRGWSQVLISHLTGVRGPGREKGPDLIDGSDVKGANTWEAIDTPRFNGCLKAGTKANHSDSLVSLDDQPNLFFVLWDHTSLSLPRCRIWVVRTKEDTHFREMAQRWYKARFDGDIKSNNFQLHPPRMRDDNVFRNTFGNLHYPLLLSATHKNSCYAADHYDPTVLTSGNCYPAS